MDIGFLFIPEHIMARDDLSLQEKVIYGRIIGLTKKEGHCYATNDWLGKQIGLSANRVSRYVSSLSDKGLIRVEVEKIKKKKDSTNRWGTIRRIYAFQGVTTNGYVENDIPPYVENDKYSNTEVNIQSFIKKKEANKKRKALKKKYPKGVPHWADKEEVNIEPVATVTITQEYRDYCKFISKDRNSKHLPKVEGQTLWNQLLKDGWRPIEIRYASRIAYTTDVFWIDNFYPEFFFRRTNQDGKPMDNVDKFFNMKASGDTRIMKIKTEMYDELSQ